LKATNTLKKSKTYISSQILTKYYLFISMKVTIIKIMKKISIIQNLNKLIIPNIKIAIITS